MKVIIIGILLFFTIQTVGSAIAPVSPKTAPLTNREQIDDTIYRMASKYSVSPKILSAVIFCESSFNQRAIGDSGMSRGLSQIHSDYHPSVTDEMAFDITFAVEFLAKNVSEGRGYWWTCYKKIVITP